MTAAVALLGLGLLAVLLLVGHRKWRALRRRREYDARRAERSVRIHEDVYWMVYRQSEADLAVALWNRDFPAQMSRAFAGMSDAFARYGRSVEQAALGMARLAALLERDPEGEA